MRLSSRGLGKEDYALIAAELRCVRAQFKGQAEALGKAETAIFARYSASEDWVERVRAHLNGEPDVATRLEEMVSRRMEQICIDGTISPELLEGAPAARPDAPADAADASGTEGEAGDEGGDEAGDEEPEAKPDAGEAEGEAAPE